MQKDLAAFWHFTPIQNLKAILDQTRLLSQAAAIRAGLQPTFVSDAFSRQEDLVNGRADYVFLSLAPYSPFFKKRAAYSTHVWFRISPDILTVPGVKIKFGASQSKYKLLTDVTPDHLRPAMQIVRLETRIRFREDGGPDLRLFQLDASLDPITEESLSTEVLVPSEVDLTRYAEGIYVVSSDVVTVLLHPVHAAPRPKVPTSNHRGF